jgi:hypothetical protein
MAPQFSAVPVAVRTRSLDDVCDERMIDRVSVLKVDVEGHEAAVFRGASRLLQGIHPPAIVFEFCDWAETRFANGRAGAAQKYLMELGYSVFRLSELAKGRKTPLRRPLTQGSVMLVALSR